jgi:DNA mismatch repair ATPase MutS/predicted GIY-YIG superfamily endonuclease
VSYDGVRFCVFLKTKKVSFVGKNPNLFTSLPPSHESSVVFICRFCTLKRRNNKVVFSLMSSGRIYKELTFLIIFSWDLIVVTQSVFQPIPFRPMLNSALHYARYRQSGHPKLPRCLQKLRPISRSSTTLVQTTTGNDFDNLMREITALNHGTPINVNSHKQVSTAVFGHAQSSSKDILQQAALGKFDNLSNNQRKIATLVCQCREVLSARRTNLALEVDKMPLLTDEDGGKENIGSSALDQTIREMFKSKKSKLHSYWKEPLLQLTRPTSKALVYQLDADTCPMAFDPLASPFNSLRGDGSTATTTIAGKKGSFLYYCRQQKEKHPDAIILTRCGDFYETFGVDAIMLVEHCGLNAMGGKSKAGCPVRNIQATLDCLTTQGFRVAVYEEAADTDSSMGAAATGGSKSRIKNRFLAQMVSSASPTYLYDLLLMENADALVVGPPSRPYMGVLSLAVGYTLVECSIEERTVRVSERMTAEAVSCRLAANPPADPLVYVPSAAEYTATKDGRYSLPFLPSEKELISTGPGARLRTRIVPPTLVEVPKAGVSDVDRAKSTIVSTFLQLVEGAIDESSAQRRATVDDFLCIPSSANNEACTIYTNPLYLETAKQLGLMHDRSIPSLISYILPESAPAATRRFLRRFLLTPPPPMVAEAMRELVGFLKTDGAAMPPLTVPPVGRILALLRVGQASAQVYGELLAALNTTSVLLDAFHEQSALVKSLMVLLKYESGMAANASSLRFRCDEAIAAIESIVSPLHHCHPRRVGHVSDRISYFGDIVPGAFFERNESPWRGRVREESVPEAYARVQEAAQKLAEAVAKDYWGKTLAEVQEEAKGAKSLIVQDLFNNIFSLKSVPAHAKAFSKDLYVHPRDRFGKILSNRYTTENVQEAMSEYVEACERAKQSVSSVLVKLSNTLFDDGHIPAVVQAAHANLILSAAYFHAVKSNVLGWNIVEMYDSCDNGAACQFINLWPYWIDRSDAVANSFNMTGLWLLTAPNMAGKSTILRSSASAALLSICGLCAPVAPHSRLRRFDHIFVRGASSDVPTEHKSAFGAEMGDIAALLRVCGANSLVFVDELARGTSPRDGTALAASVLEEMALKGMSGIFATHLHDIFELPIEASDRISTKRMAMYERLVPGNDCPQRTWTYRLEDGICTDSLALETAQRFGVPENVLERAKAFADLLPDNTRSSFQSITSANKSERLNLDDITRIIEGKLGHLTTRLLPHWTIPASLDAISCVYVFCLDEDHRRLYVGESDNIRKRIEQHRSKGKSWSNAEVIVIPVASGKTDARALESKIIQMFAQEGFPLVSTTDGRSLRPSPTSRLSQ